MDMDLTMLVALWVVGFVTVVSFFTAIGTTAIVRREGAVNSKNAKKGDGIVSYFEKPRQNESKIFGSSYAGEDTFTKNTVTDTMAGADAMVHGKDNSAERELAMDEPGDTTAALDETAMAVNMGGVVSALLSGVTKSGFDRVAGESYKQEGMAYIRQWDIAFSRQEWNWDLLIRAIECYVNAIRCAPEDQHSWINLAFVYHLVGDQDKALQCLEKSNNIARPGSYGFGRDYQQVDRSVKSNTTLFGEKLDRPPLPTRFQDRYEKLLA
ncbi:MAG: hypothetical protein KJO08_10375 [Gammaproteobacteria bacterium]|nr:hypothetical protein [Gammaproteobacteria bacterium]NNJ84963.1 hypothetical protein [Gammaproteobacteria bacterium]